MKPCGYLSDEGGTFAQFPGTRVKLNMDGEREWPGLSSAPMPCGRYKEADANIDDGALVLDAACGSGAGTSMLKHSGRDIVGIDSDRSCVEFATLTYGRAGCGFTLGDLHKLPYLGGIFDTVVSIETLEHCADPAAVLYQFRRVLRPDGQLIVTVPAGENRRAGHSVHHKHRFTRHTLAAAIEAAGFGALEFTPIARHMESHYVEAFKL